MTYKMATYSRSFDINFISILFLFSCISISSGRIHYLKLENDSRPKFTLSSFGFMKQGTLTVNVTNFDSSKTVSELSNTTFGFTLDVSSSSGAGSYMEDSLDECILTDSGEPDNDKDGGLSIVFFRLDFQNKRLLIERRGKALQNLIITDQPMDEFWRSRHVSRRQATAKESPMSDSFLFPSRNRRAAPEPQPAAGSADKNETASVADKKLTAAPSDKKLTPAPADKKLTPAPSDKKLTASPSDKKLTAAPSDKKLTAAPADKKLTAAPSDKKLTAAPSDKKMTPAPADKSSSDKKPIVTQEVKDKEAAEVSSSPVIVNSIPMTSRSAEFYSFYFLVAVTEEDQEGMYNLNFHNCLNVNEKDEETVSYAIEIIEDNNGNYLSAGSMPLPTMYFMLSLVYLIVAVVWNTVLCKSKESVYKMHYLMLVVVFVKALSCLFHGMNYHFIQKEGIHEEAWAVLFYIAYLSRGALLFITIILIGSGWAFIKHVLSDREKKLFLIVIPLQILDNIAWIIVEESEEGQSQYTVWKEIFILIDLLCCGAILFPVVWSIRHLQEASRADGKAELSLTKLKLFRQFYIMVVCYIYFTRIIVYLLKMTVPFKYEWLNELCRELATLLFFIFTGYKFRPAPDNPYLQVPTDEDEEEDIEMDTVIVGESSTIDTVKKVNQSNKEDNGGPKLRESSHEYD